MRHRKTRGRRPFWLVLGAVALVLLGLGGWRAVDTIAAESPAAVSTPSTPSAAVAGAAKSARKLISRPRAAGAWPGANGLSGVNGDPILDTAHVKSFCVSRGRACKVAQTYTDRASYETMTSGTSWTFTFFTGFDGALVISQGLVPTGGEGDLAGCAAGEYNRYWRDFGNLMVKYGRGDSVVRLGWEFNEKTMAWRATDTKTWIACYRNAADNIRAANPAVLLDWTINGHGTPKNLCGGLSTNCYPGDEYVDIIGIDNYDHYPWSSSKAVFDATAAKPEGLTWLYNFARSHGKPFSVGEWGVVPTGDAGRENPNFITWMHAWFAAHASDLAYEAYFSNCDAGGVQSSLFRTDAGCTRNPGSARVYRTLFGE